MIVIKASDIKLIEEKAINEYRLSALTLMENAGNVVANAVCKYKHGKKIIVLCGKGNNAGDGFVTARILSEKGFEVIVYHFSDIENLPEAAKINFDKLQNSNVKIKLFESPYDFECDILIDALFGIGLNRPPTDEYAQIIDKTNHSSAFKISIDIPSGLFADNALVGDIFFKPDITATFSCLKICQVLLPAKEFCGQVSVHDIGIPKELINSNVIKLTARNIPKIKRRPPDSHKGSFGHSLIIAGSDNMKGATIIASFACLKIGSGLTTCAYPAGLGHSLFINHPEIMTLRIDCGSHFRGSAEKVINFINDKAAVFLIGNGMAQDDVTKSFINEVLSSTSKIAVIDADGINALNINNLSCLSNRAVITPHLGEFSRFTGLTIDEIQKNPINIAKEFAEKYKLTLVLKSADTLIASPGGKVYISSFGSPALAKGGSGDALSGMITGLIAQKYTIEEAAILSCFILGKGAEYSLLSGIESEMTLTISDVINNFGKVINGLQRSI